jgi:hypothetical protein
MLQIEDSPRKNMTPMAWSFKISTPFFERASPLRTYDFSFSKTKDQKKA